MKQLFYLLLPVSLIAGSCKKTLDTKPTDFIQPATFYQNESQLLQALAGVYAPLTDDAGYGGIIYGEFLTTTAQAVGDELCNRYTGNANSFADVGYGVHNYTNIKLQNFWASCYTAINRANNLLASRSNIAATVDTGLVNTLMAEAQFLRGYYYFLLVQNFGGVPLRLEPSSYPTPLSYPRASAADTYAQILKDMTGAEPNLYAINASKLAGGSSRISQTAADGILARVCLYMAGQTPVGIGDQSQYANAKMWAQKVINSGLHRLSVSSDTTGNLKNIFGTAFGWPATNGNPAYNNNGYSQIFVTQAQGLPNTKECMWEVTWNYSSPTTFKVGFIGSQLGIECASGTASIYNTIGRGGGQYFTSAWLYDSYGPGDLRRDWNISPYDYNNAQTANPPFRRFNFPGNPTPGSTPPANFDDLNRSMGKWRREYEPNPGGQTAKSGFSTTISFPIIRYADVLLMLAEAEFMMNGSTQTALDAINRVRRRGYGFDPVTPNPVCDFASLTLADIQAERSRELCFEALRPNDLKRWGIFFQRLQDVISYINTNGYPTGRRTVANTTNTQYLAGGQKMIIWPIPSNELNVNKGAIQNPGW
jgi:hypothetical protein